MLVYLSCGLSVWLWLHLDAFFARLYSPLTPLPKIWCFLHFCGKMSDTLFVYWFSPNVNHLNYIPLEFIVFIWKIEKEADLPLLKVMRNFQHIFNGKHASESAWKFSCAGDISTIIFSIFEIIKNSLFYKKKFLKFLEEDCHFANLSIFFATEWSCLDRYNSRCLLIVRAPIFRILIILSSY